MEVVDYYSMFPPGYRFNPTDVELIEHYLKVKVNGGSFIPGLIHDVNVYQHPPHQLDEKYRREGLQETYFFTPRNRKYANGKRPDRAVAERGVGFWKATGGAIDIKLRGRSIGHKQTLVYYKGKPKESTKTNWIMHEFTLPRTTNIAPNTNTPVATSTTPPFTPNKRQLDDLVLCKIYHRTRKLSRDRRDVDQGMQSQVSPVEPPPLPYNMEVELPHLPCNIEMEPPSLPYNMDVESSHLPYNMEVEPPPLAYNNGVEPPPLPYNMEVQSPPLPYNIEVEPWESLQTGHLSSPSMEIPLLTMEDLAILKDLGFF